MNDDALVKCSPAHFYKEAWKTMNTVQPIRDPQTLEAIKGYLRGKSRRDYMIFLIGINTGLRISDILDLKVNQVKGTHIVVGREEKTGKEQLIKINEALRKELDEYIAGKADSDYLFTGRSKKRLNGAKGEPINRSTAYKMLNGVALKFGLSEIGTHSLRKTFGYHFYHRTKDIALLMDLFNHSEQSITLRYIGVKQDTLDEALDRFIL